jgi:hypothetical protein
MTATPSNPVQGFQPMIACAVCLKPCKWVDDDPSAFPACGGWYCKPCDAFTETDVEIED